MSENEFTGTTYDDSSGRLLRNENQENFPATMMLNNYLIDILRAFNTSNPFPQPTEEEVMVGKTVPENIDEWKSKFNKREMAFINFAMLWRDQVIPCLIKIFQAADLLLNPITKEELNRRSIEHITEWYELMLALYLTQADMFRERIRRCFVILEKTIRGSNTSARNLRKTFTKVRQKIENSLTDIRSVRNFHIHEYFFRDKNLLNKRIIDNILQDETKTANIITQFEADYKKQTECDRRILLKALESSSKFFLQYCQILATELKLLPPT